MQTNMLVSQTIYVLLTDCYLVSCLKANHFYSSLEGRMHITIFCANVPYFSIFYIHWLWF